MLTTHAHLELEIVDQNKAMSCLDRTGQQSVFERLRNPVSASESSTYDLFTCNNALINEIEQQLESRDALGICKPTLFVFPISVPICIDPCIPHRVWHDNISRLQMIKLWQQCIDGYRPLQTQHSYTQGVLHNQVETQWSLPLFGKHHNALLPVLHLASQCTNRHYATHFIMHYITMIVLQFYTMEREQWMESCADAKQEFSDQRPPHVCLLFLRYDIKSDYCPLELDSSNVHSKVLQHDFTSFLYSVLNLLREPMNQYMLQHCEHSPRMQHSDIVSWISNKVFVTKLQLLVTSRFVLMHVPQYSQKVIESLNLHNTPSEHSVVSDTMTKHYLLPLHHRLKNIHFPGTDPMNNNSKLSQSDVHQGDSMRLTVNQTRIPHFLCHATFSPIHPVAQFSFKLYDYAFKTVKQCTTREMQQRKDEWMHDVLYESSKTMDSTLASRMQKTINTIRSQFVALQQSDVMKINNQNLMQSIRTPKPRLSHLYVHLFRNWNLVRLRYSFTLMRHKLFTRLADTLQLPARSETCPHFISQPALKWMMETHANAVFDIFQSAKIRRTPHFGYTQMTQPAAQLRSVETIDVFAQDSWDLDRCSFDYTCVYHAIIVWLQMNRDMHINTYMLMRGLMCLFESESKAVVQTIRILLNNPKNQDMNEHQIVQWIARDHDECARFSCHYVKQFAAVDTKANHLVSTRIKTWKHHSMESMAWNSAMRKQIVSVNVIWNKSKLELGKIQHEFSSTPRSDTLVQHKGAQSNQSDAEASNECDTQKHICYSIDKIPWFNAWLLRASEIAFDSVHSCHVASHTSWQQVEMNTKQFVRSSKIGMVRLQTLQQLICNLAISLVSSLDAFEQLYCPAAHIQSCEDQTWRDLSEFQQKTPEISSLLNTIVTQIRSEKFEQELQGLVLSLNRSETLHPMTRATLDACHHMLQGVAHLTSASSEQNPNGDLQIADTTLLLLCSRYKLLMIDP